MKANEIKVEDADVKEMAREATRAQFAQYGVLALPDELVEQYATEMLKKKESVNGLVNRVVESKLVAALKSQLTLDEKSITATDFAKMVG